MVMVEATVTISINYEDHSIARSVAEAVEVDNLTMPPELRKSLNVETLWVDDMLKAKVKYSGELDTLIKALDDLVFSIKVAEDIVSEGGGV